MRSRNWSRTLTERSGGNGAVAVFMACYDCFFVQSMPRASKQQARYAVGRCLMLWSSNDVTQQGSRPKTKLGLFVQSFKTWLRSGKAKTKCFCRSFSRYWLIHQKARIFLVASQETFSAKCAPEHPWLRSRSRVENLRSCTGLNPSLRSGCCFGAPVFAVRNSIVPGQFAAAQSAGILAKSTGLTHQSTGTVQS